MKTNYPKFEATCGNCAFFDLVPCSADEVPGAGWCRWREPKICGAGDVRCNEWCPDERTLPQYELDADPPAYPPPPSAARPHDATDAEGSTDEL